MSSLHGNITTIIQKMQGRLLLLAFQGDSDLKLSGQVCVHFYFEVLHNRIVNLYSSLTSVILHFSHVFVTNIPFKLPQVPVMIAACSRFILC